MTSPFLIDRCQASGPDADGNIRIRFASMTREAEALVPPIDRKIFRTCWRVMMAHDATEFAVQIPAADGSALGLTWRKDSGFDLAFEPGQPALRFDGKAAATLRQAMEFQ